MMLMRKEVTAHSIKPRESAATILRRDSSTLNKSDGWDASRDQTLVSGDQRILVPFCDVITCLTNRSAPEAHSKRGYISESIWNALQTTNTVQVPLNEQVGQTSQLFLDPRESCRPQGLQ